jgi:hypothetical protein
MDAPQKPESPLQQFDREVASITQRRGETYGHPADDFAKAARLMAEFDHIEDKNVRHAIRMICVKLGRIATTPHHVDHYVDIAGYARTAVMCIDRTMVIKDSAVDLAVEVARAGMMPAHPVRITMRDAAPTARTAGYGYSNDGSQKGPGFNGR